MSFSKKRTKRLQASCGASLNLWASRLPRMSRATSDRYVASRVRPSNPFNRAYPSALSEATTCRNASSPSAPSPSSFVTTDHNVEDTLSTKHLAAARSPDSTAATSARSDLSLEAVTEGTPASAPTDMCNPIAPASTHSRHTERYVAQFES